MRRFIAGMVLAVAMVCAGPSTASAALIQVVLSDFDGPPHEPGDPFPIDLGIVDIFAYAIPPGEEIISASFSGTYGTAAVPNSTAGFDVVIGGQQLVVCAPFAPGCWEGGAAFRPFSFNLSAATFPVLALGNASLRVIQTNEFNIRLGTPTLTIETQTAVPEPATLLLLGAGLSGVAARRRLRKRA